MDAPRGAKLEAEKYFLCVSISGTASRGRERKIFVHFQCFQTSLGVGFGSPLRTRLGFIRASSGGHCDCPADAPVSCWSVSKLKCCIDLRQSSFCLGGQVTYVVACQVGFVIMI